MGVVDDVHLSVARQHRSSQQGNTGCLNKLDADNNPLLGSSAAHVDLPERYEVVLVGLHANG